MTWKQTPQISIRKMLRIAMGKIPGYNWMTTRSLEKWRSRSVKKENRRHPLGQTTRKIRLNKVVRLARVINSTKILIYSNPETKRLPSKPSRLASLQIRCKSSKKEAESRTEHNANINHVQTQTNSSIEPNAKALKKRKANPDSAGLAFYFDECAGQTICVSAAFYASGVHRFSGRAVGGSDF